MHVIKHLSTNLSSASSSKVCMLAKCEGSRHFSIDGLLAQGAGARRARRRVVWSLSGDGPGWAAHPRPPPSGGLGNTPPRNANTHVHRETPANVRARAFVICAIPRRVRAAATDASQCYIFNQAGRAGAAAQLNGTGVFGSRSRAGPPQRPTHCQLQAAARRASGLRAKCAAGAQLKSRWKSAKSRVAT